MTAAGYARFSKNIAEYSAPIRMLLKKDVPWVWSYFQNKSFLKIKEEFRSTSILKTFSMDMKTYLTTDDSNYGIGAILWKKEYSKIIHRGNILIDIELRGKMVKGMGFIVSNKGKCLIGMSIIRKYMGKYGEGVEGIEINAIKVHIGCEIKEMREKL